MPVTIISECGVNHDGDLGKALRLCDAAKEAGANIVKFQTFTPEKCIRKGKDYALLESLALANTEFLTIAAHCADIGIEFCSTPDHVDDLKFLVNECGVKRIKLGSGSLLYEPLVDAAFDTGLPVLLSTGMATYQEVKEAVGRQYYGRDGFGINIRAADVYGGKLTLMHCVSLYPCPLPLADVRRMTDLRELLVHSDNVGYSDHTEGSVAACAAVTLGATVVEKHFTLDRFADGPDHKMSLDPAGFWSFVGLIRATETALGISRLGPSPEEAAMIPRIRKDADGFQPGL